MPTNPSDKVTTVVMEMEPGQVFIKVAEPKPAPERTEVLLRKTIDAWFNERPNLVIDRTEAISKQGEMLGIHVWYHAAEDRPQPTSPPKPLPDSFTIEIHNQMLGMHSKEYLEAVLADAVKILASHVNRKESLLVVNPRRVAILLSTVTRRAAIMPVKMVEQMIDASKNARLTAWLATPETSFYVTHIAGNWFSG